MADDDPAIRHPACAQCTNSTRHPRCGAHNENGQACMRWPKKGTGVCPKHGGAAPQVKAAGERRRAEAAAEQTIAEYLATRDLATDVPVPQVLADQLNRWLGQATYLHAIVANLPADELKQRDMSGKFEKPSVWWEMLRAAEVELRATAKVMDDAKLGDRMVALAENQAVQLNAGLDWLVIQLGYQPTDVRAAAAVERMLSMLAAGELPAGTGERA